MLDSAEVVSVACALALFFGIIALCSMAYARNPRNQKYGATWLFDKWQENVYDTLFKGASPHAVGQKIGLDVRRYIHHCDLIHKPANTKRVIIDKIVGFLIIATACILGTMSGNLTVILVGVLLSIPPIALPVQKAASEAERRKFLIAEELPRFLDMLHTGLAIGLPIETAIELTSTNLRGTILAEELLLTLAETKVGAYSWQQALERLASDYEVGVLSDFVLDITNAYYHGSNIAESVARKSKEIKQSNLISMKERASKLTSVILFPILIFKILPILIIMCIPIIQQLNAL